MKQLKFLKTIALDGKPIWYGGCIYDCCGEVDTEHGHMYKLISEDLIPRGIYSLNEGKDFIIIEIEDKIENKIQEEKSKVITKKVTKKTKLESHR